MIQADTNKVTLPYDIHRKISGYYSSKPAWTNGKRVRDVLAGKPFDVQQEFGKYIVKKFGGGAYLK